MTESPDSIAALLAGLVSGAPVGMAMLDRNYRYLSINDRLADLNGVPREAHIGRSVAEVLPHLWPQLKRYYDRVLQHGEVVENVDISRLRDPTSAALHWVASYYPIRDAAGTVVAVGVVCAETTDLHALLSAMPDFIFDLSADGTHLSFHAPRTETLFVAPDAFIGKRVRDVLPAHVTELYESMIEVTLRTGAMQVFEYQLDYSPGDRRIFDARMVKKRDQEVVVVVRDVTNMRVLEEQLRQAQKMEAIGRLAGGVAHDFNNLLTVICGNVKLLEMGMDASEQAEVLGEIGQAGERAAALTRQLLMFSRQQIAERRVLNMNDSITHALNLLDRLIGEDTVLHTNLDPDLPLIEADAGQLEQVILNLIINARDAMPNGGRITVATHGSAEYAVLSVSDVGTGIGQDIRDRIFDPFFTTKPPGSGTGLGLSVVFGVVKACGGFIDVITEAGAGSTFNLHFPIVRDVLASFEPPTVEQTPPGGTETVLLVEDEQTVRSLASRVLRSCGYQLIEACDGVDALAKIEDFAAPIHLAVVDVVMPNMSGRVFAQRLAQLRPETAVLFVSGYTDDEVLRRGAFTGSAAFLPKPFSPFALASKVRELLDAH